MSKVIQYPKLTDIQLENRVTNLENNVSYFEVFTFKTAGSGTTGQVDLWQEAQIVFNLFENEADAIVTKSDIAGRPIGELAKDISNNIVTVNSLDSSGNYILSGNPVTDFCIIYYVKIKDKYKSNIPESNIVSFLGITDALEINYDNNTSGLIATNVQSAIDELADVKILQKQAGESIVSFRAVVLINDKVFYFDPTNVNHYGKCVGISRNGCSINDICDIVISGQINTGLILNEGAIYYANTNGTLTDTIPTTDLFQIVGLAITQQIFLVRLQQTIELI